MESRSAQGARLGCAASAEAMANPSRAAKASAARRMIRCFPRPERRLFGDIAEKARRFAKRMKFRANGALRQRATQSAIQESTTMASRPQSHGRRLAQCWL